MHDDRFATPMISNLQAGQIYVGDFIVYNQHGRLEMAKVKLFFRKVKIVVFVLQDLIILSRKGLMKFILK